MVPASLVLLTYNTMTVYTEVRRCFGLRAAQALAALYLFMALWQPWPSLALFLLVLLACFDDGDWLRRKAKSLSASLTAIGEMVRRREISGAR